jgi:hypothetical protein
LAEAEPLTALPGSPDSVVPADEPAATAREVGAGAVLEPSQVLPTQADVALDVHEASPAAALADSPRTLSGPDASFSGHGAAVEPDAATLSEGRDSAWAPDAAPNLVAPVESAGAATGPAARTAGGRSAARPHAIPADADPLAPLGLDPLAGRL